VPNYVYRGPGPEVAPDGSLVRPNDTRLFDEKPSWGSWQLLGEAIAEASAPVLERMATADRLGVPLEEVLKVDPLPPLTPPPGLSALTTPPAGTEGM
jgi:hypothetical protein